MSQTKQSSSHPACNPESTPIKQPISASSAQPSRRNLLPDMQSQHLSSSQSSNPDSNAKLASDESYQSSNPDSNAELASDESSQSSSPDSNAELVSDDSSQSSSPDSNAELPFISSQKVQNGFELPSQLVVGALDHSAGDSDEVDESQMSKTWKRITELDRRICDLTSQPMDIPAEADLSYLDRGILEAEDREVRELIDKLNQLMTEVKRYAQLCSAEHFQLAGDLHHERKYSQSLREIQLKLDGGFITLSRAQGLMGAAQQLRNTMVPYIVHMTPAKFRDFVLNRKVKANFLQIGMAGLPYSGKTTLTNNMLELREEEAASANGLAIHEAIICKDNESGKCEWLQSKKADAELTAIGAVLAQECINNNQLLSFAPSSEWEGFMDASSEVETHFRKTYDRLRILMQDRTMEGLTKLANTTLTFTNIWDVGVNRPVFEVLPILAPKIRNLLLVDVVNLKRDADPIQLYRPPDLDNEDLYGTRYRDRGYLLRRRTTLHYIVRCIAPTCAALLVGTFADRLDYNERENAAKRLFKAVEGMAEKMGVSEAIQSELIPINAQSTNDAREVRAAIEDLIHRDNQYKKEVPNSWISLRCILHDTKKTFIQRSELFKIAKQCGLQDDQELEEWLELFRSCASIINLSSKKFPNEYVILDPLKFICGLENLYYIPKQENLPGHLQSHVEQTKYGLLSYELVKHLCKDCEDDCNLYIEVLQRLGFIAKAGDLFSMGSYHGFYFFPSLRSKHCSRKTPFGHDSLIVLFPEEVPFDVQPQFIQYFEQRFRNQVTILSEECYNALHLSWEDHEGSADISIRFLLGFAEVSVTIPPNSQSTSFQSKLYGILKNTCIHVFDSTSREVPGMQYNLAVPCPNCKIKSHFIKFHPHHDRTYLWCNICKDCVEVGDENIWIQVR